MSRRFNESGIHTAAYYGMVHAVKQLITDGENVNHRNEQGNTPLVTAFLGEGSKSQKREILEFLFNSGADVNAVNKNGETTLHVAVKASHTKAISTKIILTLLEHGADRTAVNRTNKTPSQLAYELGNAKLGDLLLFHGLMGTTRRKQSIWKTLMKDIFSYLLPSFAFQLQFRKDLAKMNLESRSKAKMISRDVVESPPRVNPMLGERSDGCPIQPQKDVSLTNETKYDEKCDEVKMDQQNFAHYANMDKRINFVNGHGWQQQPFPTTYANVYTGDPPPCLQVGDKIRNELKIQQILPPPY